MALVYFGEEWERLYNCSFYDYESVPLEMRIHRTSGWLYLITFFVVWFLYIPCIIGMCDKALLQYSCYKLMLFLAILDLNTSIYSGFWAAFINLTGMQFCSSRTLFFWIGCLNNMAWHTQSTAIVLLAFNRCIEVYDKHWGKLLFHGKKVYCWMILPLLYGGRYLVFGYPGIYSPVYSALMFNPHAGYAMDYNDSYPSGLYNNIFVSSSILLCYAFYIVFNYLMIRKSTTTDMKQATKVFGQVIVIAFSLFAISTGFIFMLLVTTPQLYRDVLAYSFLLFDGEPAVLYLTMNKAIRQNLKKRFFSSLDSTSRVINISITNSPRNA